MSFPVGTPLNQQNIGTTIRNPSTANFLISSSDRDGFGTALTTNSANFNITKKSSLLNGFFTRIAPNEIVLDWCVDNVSAYWNNNLIYVDISGGPQISYQVPDGQYTAAALMDVIVAGLTAKQATYTFALSSTTSGLKQFKCNLTASPNTATYFKFKTISNTGLDVSQLPIQLNVLTNVLALTFPVDCPKILPTQYIDFVSPQLTTNQALKDTSTANIEQNILFRWYFAWDVPEPTDAYGYPIYQGYKRFIQRREIPFPKQIAWTPNQPIGQLTFQVLDDAGSILDTLPTATELEWAMTMLVSEN